MHVISYCGFKHIFYQVNRLYMVFFFEWKVGGRGWNGGYLHISGEITTENVYY